jgi:pilus assembly protein Flp/PilA
VTKFLQAGKASAARLVKAVNKFVTGREEGATLAEYGLLLALIAVVCIAAITILGTKISSMFVSVAGSI